MWDRWGEAWKGKGLKFEVQRDKVVEVRAKTGRSILGQGLGSCQSVLVLVVQGLQADAL